MFRAKLKLVASTPFSDFIRNASSAEKKRVYTEVMKKATERQSRILALYKAERRARGQSTK
jgi:hypothetical protein